MGSYINFKDFGEEPQNQGISTKPSVCAPLVRQLSVCNLTFEEFQNNLLDEGKDFGSMNMDEFLKNLWAVEETQMTNSTVVGKGDNNLQKQSSLILPRILSQKTVDEVWKELFKENDNEVKDVNTNSHQQQKQPTLGEITLEDFLSRAGIVKEDFQQTVRRDNNGYQGDGSSQPNNNMTIGFQQSAQNNTVMGNQLSSVPPINMNRMNPSQQQLRQPNYSTNMNFTSSMPMTKDTQLSSPLSANQPMFRTGIAEPTSANQSAYRFAVKMDGTMSSPGRNNGDTSSMSPPSYILGGGGQGRKSGVMEKATERRHKRMIKNRESAARSRARKQAYTFELEAEIAKLKEKNHELQEKQNEIMEMQNNQATEAKNTPWGDKRQCLRRTLTGPW